MLSFIARMTVLEGKEDDFIRLARELTEQVRANEPDTLYYAFFRLRDAPRRFAVVESFTNEAAEQAHQQTDYFTRLAPDLIACLDGTYVREYLDPLD